MLGSILGSLYFEKLPNEGVRLRHVFGRVHLELARAVMIEKSNFVTTTYTEIVVFLSL